MNSFERINNIFKDSFISETRNLIYIDMILLLYPISLIFRLAFMKISNRENILLSLLVLFLIIFSIIIKINIVKKNKFNYSLYTKIYNYDEPREKIKEYIDKSISYYSYRGMIIFHLILYIEIYLLFLSINGNINLNIITILFSIIGSIGLYITAIASIKDWRMDKVKKLNNIEEI